MKENIYMAFIKKLNIYKLENFLILKSKIINKERKNK